MTIERLSRNQVGEKWKALKDAIMAESVRTSIAIEIENSGMAGDCDVFFPTYSRTDGRILVGFSAHEPSRSYGFLLTPDGAHYISGSIKRPVEEPELAKCNKIRDIILKYDRKLGEKLFSPQPRMAVSGICAPAPL